MLLNHSFEIIETAILLLIKTKG
uniref:Uncharacterized protein n=1 Tax=Tetranychus urticae TaxID=32264 RepID=T1K9P2_TETUR